MLRCIVQDRAFSSRSVRSDNEWRTAYVLRLAPPGCRSRNTAGKNALPVRTVPPFHPEIVVSGAALIYLADGFCQSAFQVLLNMVFRSIITCIFIK
jgi:hypothetical protein